MAASPDGFKIQSGDCSIEMLQGVMTITANTVWVNATTIKLSAGATLTAQGGEVVVAGNPIKLN
jgi:hypothetical protein